MSTTTPIVPPRPSRSTVAQQDAPLMPPRPARQASRSPSREAFTRSPLNELPAGRAPPPFHHHSNLSASDLEDRPPSVSQLPSIGHEGDEYASLTPESQEANAQLRNVSPDLPMHQPKASLSADTAKSRIQTVTRTDSSQAAAAGIGKGPQEVDGHHAEKQTLRARASFNRSNPNLTPRPGSVHETEHVGIPSFGIHVPMYPNAGDVQAPSPAPQALHRPTITGQPGDGTQKNHHRRRSSRHDFNPPGSYGMHGHGQQPRDDFEKAWYQKHPDELAKEVNHRYDPGHPSHDWALSSEDLNKLVHGSANASLENLGTPSEQVGYQLAEADASHGTSSKPRPAHLSNKRPSSSHAHVESPLRSATFPASDDNDQVLESDDEENGHTSKLPPSRLGSQMVSMDEDGNVRLDRYGAPILASDETAKYPSAFHMQAAVNPEDRHDEYNAQANPRRPSGHSESASRPSSMHGEPLSRLRSQDRYDSSGVGTPLERVREYEPLFPEDEEKNAEQAKLARKLHREHLARHHFPSQDIWEDNPDSLGLTATVSTPDLPAQSRDEPEASDAPASSAFEHPDKEAERKNGNLPSDRARYLHENTERLANKHFKPGVLRDMSAGRPGLQPRFPSQDIWEDTPDSMRLETTVSGEQTAEPSSPTETPQKPTIPTRPAARSEAVLPDEETETSPVVDKAAPLVPDRPKPTVPPRPQARDASAASDEVSYKAKPTVPLRPASSKFAALKAGFMNDLNSRLSQGPQAPKREEPKAEEVEPTPLADARKSRARGPARRKPAAAAGESSQEYPSVNFTISQSHSVFSIDNNGLLRAEPVSRRGSSQQTSVPASTSHPASSNGGPSTETISSAVQDIESSRTAVPVAAGFDGDLPTPNISDKNIQEHKAIESNFAAALADSAAIAAGTKAPSAGNGHEKVGETPASVSTAPLKDVGTQAASTDPSVTSESQTQTGQHDITIKSPDGSQEKLTTYLGGLAEREGNVVVTPDGREEVGPVSGDTPRRIAETGHGL